MGELTEKLKALSNSDLYPFHMPGHKRNGNPFSPEVTSEKIDITEIHGFDDLHDPSGILRELEDRLARLWGAKETWIGVNGSTGMILSSLSAAKRSGRFLIARNCHKAVYHASELLQLQADYLVPSLTKDGLMAGIRAEDVSEALLEAEKKGYEYDAIVLTSPTYEGYVSEIRKIAYLLDERDTYLIVDEAHGAHFPFWKEWMNEEGVWPESALALGADLVIQSTHKTLPALTQTALLHAGERVREETLRRVRHYLNVYQTSSPSYVFMSSLDCLADLLESEEGRALGRKYAKNLIRFYQENVFLKHYHLLENDLGPLGHPSDRDPSKVVIFSEEPLGGAKLADVLRNRYHLEVEMEAPDYVIAMTSLMDSEDGLDRLTMALQELDAEAKQNGSEANQSGSMEQQNGSEAHQSGSMEQQSGSEMHQKGSLETLRREAELWDLRGRIGERIEGASEAFARKESELTLLSLEECADQSSEAVLEAADYVWLYPPGIPFLVPGERILPETVAKLARLKAEGYHVCGMRREDGRIYVRKKE